MDPENGRLLLFELAEVLKALHVPFFLIQGTALGAVRDRGFVPQEKDIDLGTLWEDLQGKQDLITRECWDRSMHVRQVISPFDSARTLVVEKYGCKADIVSFFRHGPNRVNLSPVDEYSVGRRPYGIVFPASLIQSTQRVEMFGREWRVPFPVERYLEMEYGADWRTPNPDCVKSLQREYFYISRHKIRSLP